MSPTETSEPAGTTAESSTAQPAGEGSPTLSEAIRAALHEYPDFPRPGILFRDIAPVLADPHLMRRITRAFARVTRQSGAEKVAGIESRGFLFGTAVALELQLPFLPIRKRGKLPGDTVAAEYDLEYGTAHVELQRDSISPGQPVMLIDDLLATGGTATAAASLIECLGGRVAGIGFLVELGALEGRAALSRHNILSLLIL